MAAINRSFHVNRDRDIVTVPTLESELAGT